MEESTHISLPEGSPLPRSGTQGADGLSTQRAAVSGLIMHDLAGPSAMRGLVEVAGTWVLLACIVGAYLWHPRGWTYLMAFVLVASRQYALLILMHDGFHSLLHPERRVNDAVGAWFVGAPCGSPYWGSRGSHLEHHRNLGKPSDPEFFLHSAGSPRPKRGVGRFALHFLRMILGEQILYTHLGPKTGARVGIAKRLGSGIKKLLPVLAAQVGLLALFTLAGSWSTYLTLWIFPLVTLVVLLNGIRAFCDHANHTDEPTGEEHRLVSYLSNPLERFFISPFHMNYHAEHHLFAYVPHYRLPVLRERLTGSPKHANAIQWRASYVAFVRGFLRERV